ncbi:MAG TPA: type II toxin-antitoxin system VapC family toxin [Patescibacteria group bacterium]|nr:type II toxin-antitoxin system VapC family toxin [Patescibacteria group bacterium]
MVKYLADTNVLIDHLRGDKKATKFLLDFFPAISAVSVAELIQGCRTPQQLSEVITLVSDLNILNIDTEISIQSTKLVRDNYLPHGLKFLDALIAATAIKHKLTLKTQDAKHFKFIKNLSVLN